MNDEGMNDEGMNDEAPPVPRRERSTSGVQQAQVNGDIPTGQTDKEAVCVEDFLTQKRATRNKPEKDEATINARLRDTSEPHLRRCAHVDHLRQPRCQRDQRSLGPMSTSVYQEKK